MRSARLPHAPPLRELALALGSLALLGFAHLFDADSSFGLWLRLLAATLVVLLPGRFVARALGDRTAAAALVWALAVVAGALALTFALHSSLSLTIVLLAVGGGVALPFARRRGDEELASDRIVVLLIGLGFGLALWHVAGIVHGDAFFHLGRVRKLDELGSLSLRTVDEFRDGGLHPGYAFPLWHAFLALVAKIGGVDPAGVVLHESSVVTPLAFLIAFEAGFAVFRSSALAGAVLLASVALYALAPGEGGSYATLALPGTTARQLLVPALVAAFFAFVEARSWARAATLGAAALALAFVHPTYALFVAIPLAAFVLARVALVRADGRAGALGLAVIAAPTAAVLAWLAPLVAETASHDPDPAERLRALNHYSSDLVISSTTSYHLRPEAFARTGAVAVAALVLVPFAALSARRRWAALVLGGTLVLLALELSCSLFPRFADAVSLSQARRAAGFVPLAFAFAGGAAVLARLTRWAVLPIALAAGIVLQQQFPGDFELGLRTGGPALAAWIALYGGAAALVVALVLAVRAQPLERTDWLPLTAAVLFVLPISVDGFRDWNARVDRDGYALTSGLVEALRTRVPKRAIVYADLETSYRISAAVPVYVATGPPAHVADTEANRPYRRARDLRRFLRTGDLAIPRQFGATWLVLTDEELERVHPRLPRVYRDGRFTLLRLPASAPGS
jgi:hypothetical protein